VTGAASGIGAAVARRFVDEGWAVIGWDVRPGDDPHIAWTAVDISDWDAVADASRELPPLNAAVHCAAIARLTPIMEMSRDDWDRTLAINLNGTFYVARHVFPALDRAGGAIALLSSVNSKNTTRFRAPYNASKAGVVSLTQALAVEWALAGSKVRVFAVSPGLTRTQQAIMRIESGAIDEETLLSRTPTHRWIEPAEIAAAIVRLVGPDFSALHGGNVFLDVGYDAWGGHF
jgi:NAD(P)-dependent dehydrogenase (short-subunit alcohol dehydrogenase family)